MQHLAILRQGHTKLLIETRIFEFHKCNMEEEMTMHGSMFVLLNKFVDNNLGNHVWIKLNKEAGIGEIVYDMHTNYGISVFTALINLIANEMNLSEIVVKEKFGEYLVPDLLNIYSRHMNADWKTFQLLENTELVMHRAVRKQENNANPPILHVSRVHNKLIIIDYFSKRKLASLGVGIIKGIASYFNETDAIRIIPMTNPDEERVQIRIEFD